MNSQILTFYLFDDRDEACKAALILKAILLKQKLRLGREVICQLVTLKLSKGALISGRGSLYSMVCRDALGA